MKPAFITLILSFALISCTSKGRGGKSTRDGSGDVSSCRKECERGRYSQRVIDQCEKMCGRTYFD